MGWMFGYAYAFDQDLGWCVDDDVDLRYAFHGAPCSSTSCGVTQVDGGCAPTPAPTITHAPTYTVAPTASPLVAVDGYGDNGIRTALSLWSWDRAAAIRKYGHISTWQTGGVKDMSYLFAYESSFNDDIGAWDTSSVVDMNRMSLDASAFNQPMGGWRVDKVKDMYGMLSGAVAFDQDLGWCVDKAILSSSTFEGTKCKSTRCGVKREAFGTCDEGAITGYTILIVLLVLLACFGACVCCCQKEDETYFAAARRVLRCCFCCCCCICCRKKKEKSSVNSHNRASRKKKEKSSVNSHNRATKDGTPLYVACREGRVDAARLLLEKGAAVDWATKDGATPLYVACAYGHVGAARLVLEKGAEVDRATEKGATPLFIACQEGHVDAARLLLEKGADVNKADKLGATPLDAAKEEGHSAVYNSNKKKVVALLARLQRSKEIREALAEKIARFADRVHDYRPATPSTRRLLHWSITQVAEAARVPAAELRRV